MNIYRVLLVVGMLVLSGCNRSGEDTGSTLGTKGISQSGPVTFDVISKSNTLKDLSGNFLDRGHYSMVFQAKMQNGDFPVSGLSNKDFYTMFENNLHVDESKIRVSQDSKTVSNKIMLLLDFSGSIVKDCGEPNATTSSSNLCYQIVNSSKAFIKQTVTGSQTMAIYYFNSQNKILPLGTGVPIDDVKALELSLNNLYSSQWRLKNLEGFDSTNLYSAVINSTEVVCQWFQDCSVGVGEDSNAANQQNYDFATIVTFTDGRHTTGNSSALQSEMLRVLPLYKRNYYYTIGLGDVNDGVLKQIGSSGYLKATQTDKLDEEFSKLGEQLSAFSNSFYKFDYCPAQQGGVLDLRIDVEDKVRGVKGQIKERVQLVDGKDFRCDL